LKYLATNMNLVFLARILLFFVLIFKTAQHSKEFLFYLSKVKISRSFNE